MGCTLMLLNFLVISSALVDSFPYLGNKDRAYQSGDRSSDPIYYQPRPSISSLWPRNRRILQSTQNPLFVWNHDNYKDSERHSMNVNSFARSSNAYGYGKSYESVTPVAAIHNGHYPKWSNTILAQHSTPAPLSTNNGFSEGWWNNQGLHQPQQSQIYGRPHATNSFVNSYAKPYVNQDNYVPGYSHFKPLGLMTPKPVNNFKSYDQVPHNQYDFVSTPSPVEYLPWPVPDNEILQSTESNLPKGYNRPAAEPSSTEKPQIIPPKPAQSDDQDTILPLQQPVYNQTAIPKHYIIVHINGTYEHVNNLDDIVFDENKIAHIKSKDELNQIMAIVEVEETNETENQNTLETPYDTGITKIPHDTDWVTEGNDHPDQSYKYSFNQETTEDTTYDMNYFKPEYIMPIQSTTENTIDSTTNSPPDTTTTNGNIYTDKNSLNTQSAAVDTTNTTPSTTDRTIDRTTDNVIDSTTNSIIDSTIVSTTASTTESTTNNNDRTISNTTYNTVIDNFIDHHSTEDTNDKRQEYLFSTYTTDLPQKMQIVDDYNYYEDIDYTEGSKYNTLNTQSRQNLRIEKDVNGNRFDYFDTTQTSDAPKWNEKDYEFQEPPANNYEPGETSNMNHNVIQKSGLLPVKEDSSDAYEANKDSKNENNSDKKNSPIIQEPIKLGEDRKIDVSELKKVVGEPIVWFRPDGAFWDKVTKGEQAYDAVSFYDVQCKPKLIERLTTIHHYANGTETVEYVENIWDEPDAINPREIKAKREFRDPE